MGLLTGATLYPEDAALFQQEVISRADLTPAVAEGTRNTFERRRALYAYGVMFYDVFTVVEDQAHLVLEQALRDRFIEFYAGTVPFEHASGAVHDVPAVRFDGLFDEIRQDGRLHRPQRWRLRLRWTGELIYFDGMLGSLLLWARGEGLLRGQHNRRLEPVLKWFRNYAAHGPDYHLGPPCPLHSLRKLGAPLILGRARGGHGQRPLLRLTLASGAAPVCVAVSGADQAGTRARSRDTHLQQPAIKRAERYLA